jgi:hypothetical protein
LVENEAVSGGRVPDLAELPVREKPKKKPFLNIGEKLFFLLLAATLSLIFFCGPLKGECLFHRPDWLRYRSYLILGTVGVLVVTWTIEVIVYLCKDEPFDNIWWEVLFQIGDRQKFRFLCCVIVIFWLGSQLIHERSAGYYLEKGVRHNLEKLSVLIDASRVQQTHYPASLDDLDFGYRDWRNPAGVKFVRFESAPESRQGMAQWDPFSSLDETERTCRYQILSGGNPGGGDGYLLWSRGPDGRFDLERDEVNRFSRKKEPPVSRPMPVPKSTTPKTEPGVPGILSNVEVYFPRRGSVRGKSNQTDSLQWGTPIGVWRWGACLPWVKTHGYSRGIPSGFLGVRQFTG